MAEPTVKLTPEQIELLAEFLGALDEWGCEDDQERAEAIAEFIASGCDMETYEYRNSLEAPLLPLRVIDGGKTRGSDG